MEAQVRSSSVYRFGPYHVDIPAGQLRKRGTKVRLAGQPFDILVMLLEHAGQVVTREEIQRRLWSKETFGDFENGLNKAINKLREALADCAERPVYVETLPRRGYRFIAAVTAMEVDVEPLRGLQITTEPALVMPAGKTTMSSAGRKGFRRRTLAWLSLGLFIAAAASVIIYRNQKRVADPPLKPIQGLVVLPLKNLSGDPSHEYFAEGITDEIITELAKLAGPKVISRTSTMQFKGVHKTVREIARELNVDAVVEGSVEQSGDKVRVRVQLIQGANERHLWAEVYDRQLSDALQLEADVARDIAGQVQLRLTDRQRKDLAHNRRLNPQAFQDYLQGRQYWALRTQESLTKAVEYFERAIQEDPGDARSYAGLAQCYIVLPLVTVFPESQAYPKARDAATKALDWDDSLAEAHLALAEVRLYLDWDFPGAEKEFRRTLALNPNYSTGRQWYGEFLTYMGRHQEAIGEEQAALALDPLSAIIHHQTGGAFMQARQYDRALEQYREALRLNPNFFSPYERMSSALRRQRKFVESIQALRRAVPLFGPNSQIAPAINELQSAYATGGRIGYLRQCLKVHKFYPRPAFYLAEDYADLGDKESTLKWLGHAFENRDSDIITGILTDPEFDPLRSDSRFERIIQAIGFWK